MLYLSLSISNPFVDDYNNRSWNWDKRITKHGAVGIQIDKPDWKRIFCFSFSIRDNSQDHRGVDCSIGTLLGGIHIEFYDTRHREFYPE